ncbi:MAG: PD-(D/E)XK nuclease domain-containing protein [Clostridiales Family XIII bacterium]|nr:PD-(D/E)XK nuclease domain-containing protein [Clostridiales Family XIII bacterium]
MNGTAEEALAQIDERGYSIPYSSGDRRIVKVGAEFDKDARNIKRWLLS